ISKHIITAESGQSITLPCRAPNDNIKFVHWSRADLEPEYLLVYQDGQILPDKQHPSLKNLMDLQDGQMKDGDVSLILKDVTTHGSPTCGQRSVYIKGLSPGGLLSRGGLEVAGKRGKTC
uniref:Immunoglobulin V-set domain-containing protein n=1 Tax=Amphilophus citrinellus TaxID=61819 RepID=A0A3Q0T430_AMPCI